MTTIPAFAARPQYTDHARQTLQALDDRTAAILDQVLASPVWRTLADPSTPQALSAAILRELFFSIAQYQPVTTEAGFSMLGRLPKTEVRLMEALLRHKCEEALHGDWARRDFLLSGGADERLHDPMTPAAFAVAAVWGRLATVEDPMGYLGAEYLFESLTMRIAPMTHQVMAEKGLDARNARFIVEHAIEDIKHTNLISHLVLDTASRYPQSGGAMLRCFDCFAQVYPLPLWAEVLTRAGAREAQP